MTQRRQRRWLMPVLGGIAVAAGLLALAGGVNADRSGLPELGEAREFQLTDQSGKTVRLSDYRGKVVLVNFMFTKCPDYCPTLTAVLANVQDSLIREGLGDQVQFLSITVDPENDTPELLRRFAGAMHVDMEAWDFLTGPQSAIEDVTGAYGVFFARSASGSVDHNLLTSVIDRSGGMRVQYVGERFDPDELLSDIRKLASRPFSLI